MTEETQQSAKNARLEKITAEVSAVINRMNAARDFDIKGGLDASLTAAVQRLNAAKEGQRLIMQFHDHDLPRRHFDALLNDFRDEAREAHEDIQTISDSFHRKEQYRREDEQAAAARALAQASNDLARAMTTWTKVVALATVGLVVATVGLIVVTLVA